MGSDSALKRFEAYIWMAAHGVQNVTARQSFAIVPYKEAWAKRCPSHFFKESWISMKSRALTLMRNPVLSFIRRAMSANGTNMGVQRHSPVLENTIFRKSEWKLVEAFLSWETQRAYVRIGSRVDRRKRKSRASGLSNTCTFHFATRSRIPRHCWPAEWWWFWK